jgi:hypothetical protein
MGTFCIAGQATHKEQMAHAHYMLENQGYNTHFLLVHCNMVARTQLSLT